MNARPNYPAEILQNIITQQNMTPQNIFRSVAYRLPAIFKQRLKLIPFTCVNFSPKFNILCEHVFGSSKKEFSIPTFLGSKKKNKSLPSLSKFLWL